MNAERGQAWFDTYLDSLVTQRKLSPHTVKNYRRDLVEMAALADRLAGGADIAALTHFHIRKFAAQLHAQGQDARSIARKLSAWRGFFNWLSEQVTLPSNPVDGIRAPKRSKPLPKALSPDHAVQLVAQLPPGKSADATVQRCNRAMFELLYSSGLRVSELSSLDVRYVRNPAHESAGWIDFEAHEVTVTGKGGRMRSVPVGRPALEAITAWLAVRPALEREGDAAAKSALFLTERGTRMSPRVIQLRIKAHAQALGIPADVHPHVLRHSFATHVLQSSGDLRAVQEMLGHASISATQIYTSLDFQRLAKVYDAAHPRAKKRNP